MPERQVATPLRLLLLLGTRASRLGWLQLAIAFAGALTYNVVQDVDRHFYRYWGDLVTVEATVLDSAETEHTYRPANRAKHTWEDFVAVRFRFTTSDGMVHEGMSLASEVPSDGARVAVEYPEGEPALARLVEASRDPTFGAAPIVNGVALLVVLNGLLLVVAGLRRGRRRVRLLARGALASARVAERVELGRRRRGSELHELTVAFETADGRPQEVALETHEPERVVADPAAVTVVYDPEDPARSLVLNALPGRPGPVAGGGIAPREPVSPPATLLLPVLGTAGLVAYVLYWFA